MDSQKEQDLMSLKALEFLKESHYEDIKDPKKRAALRKAARILYPED